MGGQIALHYAATYPLHISQLVLVDIAPEFDQSGATRITANTTQRPESFESLADAVRFGRDSHPLAQDAEGLDRIRYNLMLRADGRWVTRSDHAFQTGEAKVERPETSVGWAACRSVSSPTLFLRGELSDLISPEIARRVQTAIPNCRLVEIPRAGHSVPLDNPADLKQAISSFFDTQA
jgi:pimeloyl-ACP methyl ester carboxylesterase